MTRRRIFRIAVLAILALILAGAGFVIYERSGPPSYLAKRLPPRGSIPASLSVGQREAVELLYSSNPKDRARGVQMIESLNVLPDIAIPYLIALLPDTYLRNNPPPSWPEDVIRRALYWPKDFDVNVAGESFAVLARMGGPAFGPVARAFRSDEDPLVRGYLAAVLENLKEDAAADVYVDAIQHDIDANVRGHALLSLATFGGKPWFEEPRKADGNAEEGLAIQASYLDVLVITMHTDPSPRVRNQAAYCLANVMPPAVFLAVFVKEPEPMRRAMIESLQHSGAPEVMGRLLPGLKDSDPKVRAAAAQALRWVTGQDFGDDTPKWHAWWEANEDTFKLVPIPPTEIPLDPAD